MERIGELASTLGITKSMSKEDQVKKIFAYVNSPTLSKNEANIVFTNESNTDRSDWMREAYLTLQKGSGDCYSYFAVSKAFFEYFGNGLSAGGIVTASAVELLLQFGQHITVDGIFAGIFQSIHKSGHLFAIAVAKQMEHPFQIGRYEDIH